MITERIYHIGSGQPTLDCNVVNQFVTGLSFGKTPEELLPDWALAALPQADYAVGACEAFMQRTRVPKSQALATCERVFATFGCPKASGTEYELIHARHLAAYAATLRLLGFGPSLPAFTAWAGEKGLSLGAWMLRFAELATGVDHGFAVQRLTHLGGRENADRIAKAAWNVAWDIMLLEHAERAARQVVTHDAALADWHRHGADDGKPVERQAHSDIDAASLAHTLEDAIGVTWHYDADLPYEQGLWPLSAPNRPNDK